MYVSIIISIIALVLSFFTFIYNIKTSQQEKRINILLKSQALLVSYEKSRDKSLEDYSNSIYPYDLFFDELTDNRYCYDLFDVIYKPVKDPWRKTFFSFYRKLIEDAWLCDIIFRRKHNRYLKVFLENYGELLYVIYQYKWNMDNYMKKVKEDTSKEMEWNFESVQKSIYQTNLKEQIKKIEDSYQKLKENDTINELKNKTRLIIP